MPHSQSTVRIPSVTLDSNALDCDLRPFVGRSRLLLVEGLTWLWNTVLQGRRPCWISLEAPSGWGKTRVAREFYAQLAADQESPAYWPPIISASDRKVTHPGSFQRPAGSIPGYLWWGISCSVRPSGQPTMALRTDLAQLESHAPYLEAAWTRHTSLTKRVARKAKDGDWVKTVALELASLALPPGLITGADWLVRELRTLRDKRSTVGEGSIVGGDGQADIVDSVVNLLSLISGTGFPMVVVVEDFHSADEALFELVGALLHLDRPIMVITTAWPDRVLSVAGLADLLISAETRGIVHRVKHDIDSNSPFPDGAGLVELEEDARAAIVRSFFPTVSNNTTKALVDRYHNPLVLEAICQLPRYKNWQRESDLEFDMSSEEIIELPELLDDVYREFWNQLPESVRVSLAIAWLVTPSNISATEAAGDNTWIHSLLYDVVKQLYFMTDEVVSQVLDHVDRVQGWVRAVGDTGLHSFAEPEMAYIAGQDGSRLLRKHLVGATRTVLATLARTVVTKDYDLSIAGARTVLALHARGFIGDAEAIKAISTLLTGLNAAPRELKERRRLYRRFTALDDTGVTPLLLFNIHHLGSSVFADSGHPNQAIVISSDLVDNQIRVLGVDHPHTLTARNNLASFLGEAGFGDEAIEHFRSLVADQIRVLGNHDPATVTSWSNLASLLGQSGRVDEAIGELRDLLDDQTRVVGADHPALFVIRNNLAELLGQVGHVEEAITESRDLLDDRERVLGADHPDTLKSRNNLARMLGNVGHVDDAIIEFRCLREDQIRIVGADHPDTLRTRNNLATFLGEVGRVDDAIIELQELLNDNVRIMNANQPAVFSTRFNLATFLGEVGRVDDAIIEFRCLREDQIRILGADHPDTFRTRTIWLAWRGGGAC